MRHPLIWAFFAVLLASAAARAQGSESFDQLQRVLKTNDTVIVVDVTGHETRGKVVAVSTASLEIIPLIPTPNRNYSDVFTDGPRQTFAAEQIVSVMRSDIKGDNPETLYGTRHSFRDLQRRLKPGQVVDVIEVAGRKTTGRVTQVSPTTLAMVLRKENPRDGSGRPRYEWTDERRFAAADVTRVARPGPIWDGAVKGAAIGLIPALILANSCHGCTGNGQAGALMVGIGAAIGIGIDAAFGPKTLYRARR